MPARVFCRREVVDFPVVVLFLGTYNSLHVRTPSSAIYGIHAQVHLFDIDIPGKVSFKESDTLSPGPSPTVIDTGAGRLGVAICYDLRFPELAMLYARRGAQLIVYPGVIHSHVIA